jgi:hypothetical protein
VAVLGVHFKIMLYPSDVNQYVYCFCYCSNKWRGAKTEIQFENILILICKFFGVLQLPDVTLYLHMDPVCLLGRALSKSNMIHRTALLDNNFLTRYNMTIIDTTWMAGIRKLHFLVDIITN